MNHTTQVVIGVCAGILVGAGGTWLITPKPAELTRADLLAAIEADPELQLAATVEIPTDEEARAAFQKAHANSGLVWDRDEVSDIQVSLGQCDSNPAGPGVACVTTVKFTAEAAPQDRTVGFARNAAGEWTATLY
jgi:hypothetical protein